MIPNNLAGIDTTLCHNSADIVLISDSILSQMDLCRYMPGFRSDHSFIELGFTDNQDPRGPVLWKFNSTLLDKPEFVFKIKETIKKAILPNQQAESPPDFMWEMIKCEVIGATIDFSKINAKQTKINLNKYYEKLACLQTVKINEPNENNLNQMKEIEPNINKIVEKKTRGSIFRAHI